MDLSIAPWAALLTMITPGFRHLRQMTPRLGFAAFQLKMSLRMSSRQQ